MLYFNRLNKKDSYLDESRTEISLIIAFSF
jgi:hypothetical protein